MSSLKLQLMELKLDLDRILGKAEQDQEEQEEQEELIGAEGGAGDLER